MKDPGLHEVGTAASDPVWESPLPADLLDGVSTDERHPAADPTPTKTTTTTTTTTGARSRSVLEHGWWPVVAWVAGLLLGAGALYDNSFLTHLATGRLIRSGGAPHQDVYSFASGGRPIVVQSWLASWAYAALEAVGGATAIRLLIAGLCGVLLLTLWRLSKPAESLLGRLALTAMAGMVGLLWWNERPQIIGFVVLALIALVLQEERSPWWLVPLFALWVNVHGSFPMGVVFVGMTVGIGVVARRRLAARDLAVAGATLVGVVGGAALSPYGFEMLTFPIELLGRSSSLILIAEWRPLSFATLTNVVFVGEAVLIAALLAWRRSWLRLAVAAVFIGLALMAVRNVALAALVLIPLAAPALAGLGSPDTTRRPGRRRMLGTGAVGALAVAAFIVATPGYDLSAYPTDAVDWMEAHGYSGRADGADARVLTHDYNGNYLEWRYGAAAGTWIDDRAELHSFETMRDYVFLLSDKGDADEILARHPHDVVLWAARSTLADHLADAPGYEIVYRDGEAVVACRLASSFC